MSPRERMLVRLLAEAVGQTDPVDKPKEAHPQGWLTDLGNKMVAAANGSEEHRPADLDSEILRRQLLGAKSDCAIWNQRFNEQFARAERAEQELKRVRADEREACAKVCEEGHFLHDDAPTARFGRECAAAIRARTP